MLIKIQPMEKLRFGYKISCRIVTITIYINDFVKQHKNKNGDSDDIYKSLITMYWQYKIILFNHISL